MTEHRNAFVRLSELKTDPYAHGELYASADAPVADELGLTKIGAIYTVVPPGKTACPFHVHHAEDEMFVLLSGRGEYRFGTERHQVQAGDVLGAPIGGPEYAHQLLNTGQEPLVYLSISSKADVDVCEYPDSGKFGVMSGRGKKRVFGGKGFSFIGRAESAVDYFDGEEGDTPPKD